MSPSSAHLATRRIIAVFRIARITTDHNRVSNSTHQTTLSLALFTRSVTIRPFMQILKTVVRHQNFQSIDSFLMYKLNHDRLILYHRDKFHRHKILYPIRSSRTDSPDFSHLSISTDHSFVANFRLSVSRERAFHWKYHSLHLHGDRGFTFFTLL